MVNMRNADHRELVGERERNSEGANPQPQDLLTHCVTLAKALNFSVSLTLLRNIYYLPGIAGGSGVLG